MIILGDNPATRLPGSASCGA